MYTRSWDETKPNGATTAANTLDTEIHHARVDLRERICALFTMSSADFSADPVVPRAIALTHGTITTDVNTISASVTWNAVGVTFTALEINVTSTASAAGSKLIDLTVGGVSQFSVTKVGAVAVAGALAITGALSGVTTLAMSGALSGATTGAFSSTVSIGGALTYGGVTLSNAVTGTGNMVLSASPTFTGTISAAALTLSGVLTYGGVALSAAVTGTGNMVLSASPTFTGTAVHASGSFTGTLTLTGATVAGTPTWSSTQTMNITGNVTGNVSGSSGSTTGNAATATALQTARAINGTNFDGTAAITVTAAAGTLTGATLNATVTASSLTSVGTLTSLTVSSTVANTITVNAADDPVYIRQNDVTQSSAVTMKNSAGNSKVAFGFGNASHGVAALQNSAFIYVHSTDSFKILTNTAVALTINSSQLVTIAAGLTVSAGTTAVQALTATTIDGTNITASGAVVCGAGLYFNISGRGLLKAASDGNWSLRNNADSANGNLTVAALTATTGTFSGALSGVTTLAMSGALSGATTGAFSGLLTAGDLQVGGGATVTSWLTATVAWDMPSISSGGPVTTTVAVTGAAVGDLVVVSQPQMEGASANDLTVFIHAYVSAADVVTLVAEKAGGSATDFGSKTYRVFVLKF